MFEGLFEVHITIDHQNNFLKLLEFQKKYVQRKGMKLVFAASSICNNQYMISYFTNKKSESIVIENALEFKKEMGELGIKVLRVKVEGYNCKGIPYTNTDYQIAKKYIQDNYPNSNNPYFEYHVKMANSNLFTFDQIEEALKCFNGNVAMSVNLCSSSKKPLITIRKYDEGRDNALNYKNYVLDYLKERGFKFENQLQEEFSVYDDNSSIDSGWLISK